MNGMNGGVRTFNMQTLDHPGIGGTNGMSAAGRVKTAEHDGERVNEPTERQREPPHSDTPVERAVGECRAL
jgi:hypothetical protein